MKGSSLAAALAAALTLAATATGTAPRYEAKAASVHPGAIRVRGDRRVWTYLGDTLRVSLRDTGALAGARRPYRVCYRGVGRPRCRARTLVGRMRDAWRLRVLGPWVPCGRRHGAISFSWAVDGRVVATRRVYVYECV